MSFNTQVQALATAMGTTVKGKVSTSLLGVANGVATLDATGKIPTSQIPGSIDEVLEYANFASFPVTGASSLIYVALDNNKTYRWSGSVYVEISPSEVNSVNGMTGAVIISNISGNAGTATKFVTPVNIAGISFDGSASINIPFANISTRPTSVSGYGITDAMTTAHSANSITGFGTTTAMNGVSAAGSSTLVSRADHIHASDTAKQSTIGTVGILKGAGAGSISAATAGTDYVIPSGNVATATSLANARTINGISFNGTANIDIEDRLGTPILSATTTTIGTSGLGDYIHITGTNNISSFGTASAAGIRRTLNFDSALTISYNATTLLTPGSVNLVTLPNTIIEVISESTTSWKIVSITHPSISITELGYLDGVTSGIQNQIDSKIGTNSPTFTGTPTLPTGTIAVTQTAGDSSTKIATTAFTTSAIATLSNTIGATDTDFVAVFNAAMA